MSDRKHLVGVGIDEHGVVAVACGSPLVLPNHHRVAIVLVRTFVDFVREGLHQTLHQSGDRERILQVAGHVTDADLHGAEVMMRPHVPPDFSDRVDEARVDHVVDQPHVLAPIPHECGHAGGRQAFHHFRPMGMESRVAALPEGTTCAEGEQGREMPQDAVADHHGLVARVDPHVDVQAKGDQPPRHFLQQIDEVQVAFVGCDPLLLPKREGVGRSPP